MNGTWLVVVEGAVVETPGELPPQGTPTPVEIEVEAAEVDGWWVATLDSSKEQATTARVAVVKVAARHGLPVLEILAPDEMSREEEIGATCAKVLNHTIDHALGVLQQGHEALVETYTAQAEALRAVRLGEPS